MLLLIELPSMFFLVELLIIALISVECEFLLGCHLFQHTPVSMLRARLVHTLTIPGLDHLLLTSFRLSSSLVWLLYNLHDHVSELTVQSTLIWLLKKPPVMSSVGNQSTDIYFFWILSVTKKYRMLMCFVLLPLDALPFFSRSTALLLS